MRLINTAMRVPLQLFIVLFALASTGTLVQAQISVSPNSWTVGAPMPTAREGAFVGVIGTKIYAVGGSNGSSVLNVNEIYDTTTNTWSTGAPLPTARWLGASGVVNGVLYAIGGANNNTSTALTVVEAYNPSTNSWSTMAPMPIQADSVYGVVSNNVIYVVGGYAPGNGRLASVTAYNPASNTWSTLASLHVGKSNPALGAIGSMLISAGGLANSGVTSDNEGYSIANNQWSTLTPTPTLRNAACFETVGNTLYVAGGNPANNTGPQLTSMDTYDAVGNTWTTGLPAMPYAIVAAASASVNGRFYCMGGSNNGNPNTGTVFNYVQIYQPAGLQVPTVGSVVGASSFGGFSSAAPGSFIEIYGSNLTNVASDARNWGGSDFVNGVAPTSLDGTKVSIGGQAAFVSYISSGQVNALVPSNVPTGLQQVTITNSAGISAPFNINVNTLEPGLLATSTFVVNGTPYAVAFNADGSYVLPVGAIPGLTSHPANVGDEIVFYGVGFGPVSPSIPVGQIVQQSNTLTSTFQMSVGGAQATAQYSGLAPNYTGLYQFNIIIPSIPASAAAPIAFTLNGVAGTQSLAIAIGN